MRYGSIPIVRKTGGLQDTVLDFDKGSGTGSGFVFADYTADALIATVSRSIDVFNNKPVWEKLATDVMEQDFSWNRSAALYTELYLEALARKGRIERPA